MAVSKGSDVAIEIRKEILLALLRIENFVELNIETQLSIADQLYEYVISGKKK
jgi:hypothetical protein